MYTLKTINEIKINKKGSRVIFWFDIEETALHAKFTEN